MGFCIWVVMILEGCGGGIGGNSRQLKNKDESVNIETRSNQISQETHMRTEELSSSGESRPVSLSELDPKLVLVSPWSGGPITEEEEHIPANLGESETGNIESLDGSHSLAVSDPEATHGFESQTSNHAAKRKRDASPERTRKRRVPNPVP